MNAHEALERVDALYGPGWTPAQAVAEAVSIYLKLDAEIKALEVARTAAKRVITGVMTETMRDRFDTNAGMAYIANPGLRICYDAKGIDALIENRPDLAEVLAPHRIETMVAGSLVVRAKGGSK